MVAGKTVLPVMEQVALLLILQLLFLLTPPAASSTTTQFVGKLAMFVDKLPVQRIIPGYIRTSGGSYKPTSLTIGMYATKWKFHRDLPPTNVFAFGTSKSKATVPGPCIQAMTDVKTYVRWKNYLPDRHLLTVDPTLEAARPPFGVPTVVHLHGAVVEAASDGGPQSWFTRGFRYKGPEWRKSTYVYHNPGGSVSMWYHDHTLGITGLNTMVGLLGTYKVINPKLEQRLRLPESNYDMFLAITDRNFTKDGQVWMNRTGIDPAVHPNWQPEYYADVIIVNGKAWPYMDVQRRKYRFRIVNASPARFYNFSLSQGLMFTQIAADNYYLSRPVEIKDGLLMGPGEVADVIVDFAKAPAGSSVLMTNNAQYPYPIGATVNELNSQVMKFRVGTQAVQDNAIIPATLVHVKKLKMSQAIKTRNIVLTENTGALGPTSLVMNFANFSSPMTEKPKRGTTEIWKVINLSKDNHPFHTHLVGFQVGSEQALDPQGSKEELLPCVNKNRGVEKCNLESYFLGNATSPPANEADWKNVYKMQPYYVTSILIRFSRINFEPFPFDPTTGRYVYHCHILNHEDNMMMRPFTIL